MALRISTQSRQDERERDGIPPRFSVRGSARLTILVGLLLATASTADAQGVSLQASAGLAGHVKPGRWTSVLVDVSSASRPISGELVVEWGPTRLQRTVTLSPGNARHFELY